MKKELLQFEKGAHGISAGVTTSGTTPVTSAAVCRQDASGAIAKSALVVVNHGAQEVGTVDLTLTILEGPTSSPATAVTLEKAIPVIDCDAAGTSVFCIDLEGMDLYEKFVLTPAVTASGVVDIAMSIILGDFDKFPPEASAAPIYRKA